jgi:small subunit ribosomal protein S1
LSKITDNNPKTMEELLASLSNLTLTRGQIITGEVVSITDQEVILDLGMKAEGVIPARDFPEGKLPKVGDKVEAYVVEPENESSQVLLSMQSIQKVVRTNTRTPGQGGPQVDFSKIIGKYTIDEIYPGTVTKVTQFGVFVALEEGVEGLIHSSKVTNTLKEGEKIQVTIDSIEPERRRIALSPVVTSTKDLIYR